jgi:hypothetical protein
MHPGKPRSLQEYRNCRMQTPKFVHFLTVTENHCGYHLIQDIGNIDM